MTTTAQIPASAQLLAAASRIGRREPAAIAEARARLADLAANGEDEEVTTTLGLILLGAASFGNNAESQECTGLEPPEDRQELLTCNFTADEIGDIYEAFGAIKGDHGLYAVEVALARICREWLANKKGAA